MSLRHMDNDSRTQEETHFLTCVTRSWHLKMLLNVDRYEMKQWYLHVAVQCLPQTFENSVKSSLPFLTLGNIKVKSVTEI